MKELLDLGILTKTFDDLSVGVGIFEVENLDDNKSIRYVFMNKVILYEMRKEREEVFGKKIIEVAPEAYDHEGGLLVIETYRRVAAEGGSVNLGLVEYSNHMVAGTYECSVHHIQDKFIYVMLRNVTELEQAKNQLEIKNKELSQFAHLVAHDLKEPLRTVSGFIQLIKNMYQEKLDDQATELITLITNAANRMTNVITDLLELSIIGQTKSKSLVDCQLILDLIQQDLASRIKETNTIIEVNELPKVNGFETELRLLFQNLISNAIKFSKPGVNPRIIVSAKKGDDKWIFSVQDNGIGIPEEYQKKVFEAFQKLHARSEYEGTGIGLSICKKIVELHDGQIWITSQPENGSTFSFDIPI